MCLTAPGKERPTLQVRGWRSFFPPTKNIVILTKITAILLITSALQVNAKGIPGDGMLKARNVKLTAPPAIIKGTVKDDQGTVLTGVSIAVMGSTKATQTNQNGEFTIELADQSPYCYSLWWAMNHKRLLPETEER